MSEALHDIPAQRAPLEVVQDPATQTEQTAQVIELPVQQQEQYVGRHRAEVSNPDRFSTRVAGRISELAGGFADNMANRRTVGQTLYELDDKAINFSKEKIARGKEIATKIGGPIVSEIKFDAKEAATGFKEIGIGLKDIAKDTVEGTRTMWKTRADAARERRSERKEARQMARTSRQNVRNYNKSLKAEQHQKRNENIKTAARLIGKGALLGVGIVPGAVAYGAYKGAELSARGIKNGAVRANGYAGKKIEQAVDYGTSAIDAYAEVQKYKQADKAEKVANEKAAHNARISIARREAQARIRAKADTKAAKVAAKFEKKIK